MDLVDLAGGILSAPDAFEMPEPVNPQAATVKHTTTRVVITNLVFPISGIPRQTLAAVCDSPVALFYGA
jgi:hypothetical protein